MDRARRRLREWALTPEDPADWGVSPSTGGPVIDNAFTKEGPMWRVWWTDTAGEDHVLWTRDAAEAERCADQVKANPRLTLQAWDREPD